MNAALPQNDGCGSIEVHSPDECTKKSATLMLSSQQVNQLDSLVNGEVMNAAASNGDSSDELDSSNVYASVRSVSLGKNSNNAGSLEVSFSSPIEMGSTMLSACGKIGIRFIENRKNGAVSSVPSTLDVEMCTTDLRVSTVIDSTVPIRNSYGSGTTVDVKFDTCSKFECESSSGSPAGSMRQPLEDFIRESQAELQHEIETSIFQCMSESSLTVVRNRIHDAAKAYLLPPEAVSELLKTLDSRMHAMIAAAIIQQPKSMPTAPVPGERAADTLFNGSIHKRPIPSDIVVPTKPLKGALINRKPTIGHESDSVGKGSWWKRTIASWKDDLTGGSNTAAACQALTEVNTKKNAQVVEQDVHTSTGIYHELTRTYSTTVNMFANPFPVYTLVRQGKKRAHRKPLSDNAIVSSASSDGIRSDDQSVSTVQQPSWIAKLLPKLSLDASKTADEEDVPWWEAPVVVHSSRAVHVRFRDTVDICDLEDVTSEDEDEYSEVGYSALDASSADGKEHNGGMELGFLFSLPESESGSEPLQSTTTTTIAPSNDHHTHIQSRDDHSPEGCKNGDGSMLSPVGSVKNEPKPATMSIAPVYGDQKGIHHTSQVDITPVTNSSRSVLGDLDDADIVRKVGKEIHAEIAELDKGIDTQQDLRRELFTPS
eukprot:m.622152 g.622152  ORF g.622152 m.622152 type:complete len:655 (-) comp22542_c0_seq5:2132-4096(-)